ncbi:MAG: 3-isopropylmalate dehydratase small subunit [Spirochaetales bacterium]
MARQGETIRTVSGTGIAVRGNDIDTDRIIPARYMKVVSFDGLGEFAFRDVRYDDEGHETDHPFNNPDYRNAEVLLVNKNFGCGSSREHAPQALMRWGIKAVVGESFAEIFAGNCNALGIPAVSVSEEAIGALMTQVESDPLARIEVDLDAKEVRCGDRTYPVEFVETYRQSLVSGRWDSTALLLANREEIDATVARLPYLNEFVS